MAELQPIIVFHGRHFVRHLGIFINLCKTLRAYVWCRSAQCKKRRYYLKTVFRASTNAAYTQTHRHIDIQTHIQRSGSMTAARRIWSSLLSFIVIFTLSLRFLAINSALCLMTVQGSHLFSQSQDLHPFRRVFGQTFHGSTSTVPSCDVSRWEHSTVSTVSSRSTLQP